MATAFNLIPMPDRVRDLFARLGPDDACSTLASELVEATDVEERKFRVRLFAVACAFRDRQAGVR